MPYLHGRWKVNFRYAEITGNQGRMSGCQGVWPYIYSIEYFVYQYPRSTEYVLCRDGDDCVENKNPPKRLQQAAFEVFEKNCALREHGLSDSGLNLFLMNDYRRRATGGQGNGAEPLDESWFTHNAEFEKVYGRPTDEQGKPFNSSTWSRWKVPGQKRVNTIGMSNQQKLQVRKNATLMPWGRICDQFDWPDVEELGPGFASPFYKGAMRHENMTWIWIKSLETCRCFPRYSSNQSPRGGSMPERAQRLMPTSLSLSFCIVVDGVAGVKTATFTMKAFRHSFRTSTRPASSSLGTTFRRSVRVERVRLHTRYEHKVHHMNTTS